VTGSSYIPIVVPIVAFLAMGAWLGLVFYADRHPGVNSLQGGQHMAIQDDHQLFDEQVQALRIARDELLRALNSDVKPHWNIDFGKFHIPVPLASTGLSWLYVGLDTVAFGFGIACIFLGGAWRELGIALIVGAMFGMSTFVGQLLTVQLEVEEHKSDLLWRDDLTKAYAARLKKIDDQLGALAPSSVVSGTPNS
jgi:hypothetical protein